MLDKQAMLLLRDDKKILRQKISVEFEIAETISKYNSNFAY